MAKKILLGLWFSLLLFAILVLFWQNEFKYSLPTPIPKNYHDVAVGSQIDLGKCWTTNNKPVFIHFFNPDCPCSRFNVPHVSGLIKKYGDRINFKIVVLNQQKNFTIEEIQKKFDAAIPVYFDSAMASKCGVFSTPQAVIIDPSHHLYYRGNYNKTRYCTNADSNYAQMAIDSLLKQIQSPSFDALALRAYGCSLPKCTK
ncbi:thioredoxin fold domain-containing protein [Flavobacterium sp. CLA17]|uniref:TlpA family protein disulfide reductase n=1 Tax=Flavobacterium sp. CLA17 TaxID=2724135 RepID=UPI00149293EF|nr:thioredoxin fold domain-containing protein [Flavobacterium sp. CLA17]QSB25227.1 thioredoxin fold domain-containing protein [Flavobacterium sp. CLA17]